jgi:hypothetical protein
MYLCKGLCHIIREKCLFIENVVLAQRQVYGCQQLKKVYGCQLLIAAQRQIYGCQLLVIELTCVMSFY